MWKKILPSESRHASALFMLASGVASSILTLTAGAQETRLTIVDCSPTSWVARGYDNYTVSPAVGWTFTPSRNFDNGVGFNITGAPLAGTSVDLWFLNFAAPGDAVITPGFYPNFQRWPFQNPDRPGLEFGSTGRLDNMASGFFEVFVAQYAADGRVLAFAADFTHYGETNPNNYAIVQLRYNAVPAPGAAAVALTVVSGVSLVPRRRRR